MYMNFDNLTIAEKMAWHNFWRKYKHIDYVKYFNIKSNKQRHCELLPTQMSEIKRNNQIYYLNQFFKLFKKYNINYSDIIKYVGNDWKKDISDTREQLTIDTLFRERINCYINNVGSLPYKEDYNNLSKQSIIALYIWMQACFSYYKEFPARHQKRLRLAQYMPSADRLLTYFNPFESINKAYQYILFRKDLDKPASG